MPRYELMYLLGSHVTDAEAPAITSQILKFVEDAGGSDVQETHLGKKKLAYPIKKTRNGYYVVVDFTMGASKVNELDARVRTQDQNIIRYILVNLDEHLKRKAKDLAVAAKMVRRIPPEPAIAAPASVAAYTPNMATVPELKEPKKIMPVLEDISSEELDKKIEEALGEDIIK